MTEITATFSTVTEVSGAGSATVSVGSCALPARRGASTPRITSSFARPIISGVPNTREATYGRLNIVFESGAGLVLNKGRVDQLAWPRWRSRCRSEGQTKRFLSRLVGRDLGIDLLGIVASFSKRLATALEPSIDLLDLRARVFERINPIPLGRQPRARDISPAALIVVW